MKAVDRRNHLAAFFRSHMVDCSTDLTSQYELEVILLGSFQVTATAEKRRSWFLLLPGPNGNSAGGGCRNSFLCPLSHPDVPCSFPPFPACHVTEHCPSPPLSLLLSTSRGSEGDAPCWTSTAKGCSAAVFALQYPWSKVMEMDTERYLNEAEILWYVCPWFNSVLLNGSYFFVPLNRHSLGTTTCTEEQHLQSESQNHGIVWVGKAL